MDTYNGYHPNEERTTTHRPRKADNGHSPVASSTRRVGYGFRFRYAARCECGKTFTGWDSGAVGARQIAHTLNP